MISSGISPKKTYQSIPIFYYSVFKQVLSTC